VQQLVDVCAEQAAGAVATDREATIRFLIGKNDANAYAVSQMLREFWRASP
jgi:hypothetical protein